MGKHEYRLPAFGPVLRLVLVLISTSFVFFRWTIEISLIQFIGPLHFFMGNPAFLDGNICIDNKNAVKPAPEHPIYKNGVNSMAF
jgi:hypothetical protein